MKIGILGAGQLARMMALAGIPLGHTFSFYDSAKECCAESLGTLYRGHFEDAELLQKFSDKVDVITYEFENVPLKTIELLPKSKAIFPSKLALDYTQDRLKEKNLFKELGLPTPNFMAVDNENDLSKAGQELGFPFVVKTRSGGYDGKGQKVINSEKDLSSAAKMCQTVPCIAEAWVRYEREVSLISVCGKDDIKFYDLNENEHRKGVLYRTQNKPNDPMQAQAKKWSEALSQKLNYKGVLTIEFFQCGDKLLANEYAPRVHNSGHWTIEGAVTSQFENHLRAVADLPLGSTESLGFSNMYNLLGSVPKSKMFLEIDHLHLHDYGKTAREGRKVGHFNLCHQSLKELELIHQKFLLAQKNSLI